MHSEMAHAKAGSRSFTCQFATHTFIHKWNEPSSLLYKNSPDGATRVR